MHFFVIRKNTGEYHMIDWKRCSKQIHPLDGRKYNKFGKPPCAELVDNTFSKYSLQQNLYAAILYDSYNITVKSMRLVQLHERQNKYILHVIPEQLALSRQLLDLTSSPR